MAVRDQEAEPTVVEVGETEATLVLDDGERVTFDLVELRAALSDVVCPGCGGPTYDAGLGKRPHWLCLRAKCVFSWGWKLDFAEPLGPPPAHPPAREPAPAMVAIPYSWRGELLRRQAVTWPRRRA
jgi:hypothetical protein